MVLDLYSHIMDEDRKRNAKRLEEAFYQKKDLDPEIEEETFDAKMEAEQKMTAQENAVPANQQIVGISATPAASEASAATTAPASSADTEASIASATSTTTAMPASPVESAGSGLNAAAIARVLSNPQMMAILAAMSKAMGNDKG